MSKPEITDYLKPEDIQEAFKKFRDTLVSFGTCEETLKTLKNKLDVKKAEMAQNPDFKWGKNDDERTAQVMAAFPSDCNAIMTIQQQMAKLGSEKELLNTQLSEYNLIIQYFKVLGGLRD